MELEDTAEVASGTGKVGLREAVLSLGENIVVLGKVQKELDRILWPSASICGTRTS